MKERLKELIRYKTGGRQKDFAELLGWTPQYIAKLLRGESLGISPVITLLETLPEINARWLLLGQGDMLEADEVSSLRERTISSAQALLEMERFIPFMSPAELFEFKRALISGDKPDFSPDRLSAWREQANEREIELGAKFAAAKAKSNKLCRRKTANK